MAAAQRLRQGIRALLAFTQRADYSYLDDYLTPRQIVLFHRMRRSEQLHSLRVLRDILAQDNTLPHDLAVAALLHDVGKIRYPLAIWQKSLAVLMRRFAPETYARWGSGTSAMPWQRACLVAENHPAWSAELVAETGATDRALWLIAHHADDADRWRDHPHYAMLIRLKHADDTN